MKWLLIVLFLIFPFGISAQDEMTSPEYKLKLEQIEASDEAALRSIRPEVALKLREDGFYIKKYNDHPFTFTIHETNIDLSETRTQQSVQVSTRSEEYFGYQIVAFPWTPLQTPGGEQIPYTKCNGKTQTCNTHIAQPWTDDSKGWGYNLSGPDAPLTFKDKQYFRPISLQEYTPLAAHPSIQSERATQLTFKVQKEENDNAIYSSIIQLFAFPL